jgi:hypothetical protein
MQADVGSRREAPSLDERGDADARDVDSFVRHRLTALGARLSRRKDQPIDRDAIEEVRFLRELSSLWREQQDREAAQPRGGRLVPVLFLLTALSITGLVFARLPSIGVDADLLCSAVTFRTSSPVQLTGLTRLTLLQAQEFAPVELEDAATGDLFAVRAPLELRPESAGTLTLSSVAIPADALVSLERGGDAATWRLSIEDDRAVVGATAAGAVHVSSGGAVDRTVAFGRGGVVELRAGASTPRRVDLHVTPEQTESLLAGRLIPITEIGFETAVQDAAPGTHGVLRGRASSVLEGSVFNVSLAGRESKLRNRDTLELDVTNATVRELRLEPEGIRVSVAGEAKDVRLGHVDRLQTLRPSYLEWLAEHHALQLAWGAAAWLFALFLGGVRWWHEFAH